MIINCSYCNKDISIKGFSTHLRTRHDIFFKEYVIKNREQFPKYIDCPICGKICTGTSCSRKCRAKLQTRWQSGRPGWSKGLTKYTHSGLRSMAEKASLRKGIDIWARMSEETRTLAKKKLSEKALINNKGTKNPMYGKKHTPEAIRKIFKHRRISSLEHKLIEFLDNENIKYYFQFFIGDKDLYSYDFKIKGQNIIIELDGDYWHGGPGCKKYHDDVLETKTRDRIKQEYAIQNGYKILRFWESDLKKNKEKIFEQILEEIKK